MVVDAVADLAREPHRALGLAHAVAGQPARRRDERLRPQPRRSQPRRVSSHHTSTRFFQSGAGCSPTGRSVGTAPQMIQPPPSRKRRERHRVVEVEHVDVEVTRRGPASSARRRSPRPHTCTRGEARRRGERGREHVGRGSRSIGGRAGAPAHERGLVEEEHERRVREGARRRVLRARAAHARATRPPSVERGVDRYAGFDERDAERERTRALHLHERAAASAARRRASRNASSPPCAIASNAGVDRRVRSEVGDARSCRRGAVHAVDRTRPTARRFPRAACASEAAAPPEDSGRQRSTSAAAAAGVVMRQDCRSRWPFRARTRCRA